MAPLSHRRNRLLALAAGVLAVALVAAGPAAAATFENTTPIVVNTAMGSSDPFPSEIDVSGLSGVVTDVDVTLHDAYHDNFDLYEFLMVTPSGRRVGLVADVCNGPNANDVTLTLSHGAAALPVDGDCTTGTFRPTDHDFPMDVDWEFGSPEADGSDLGDLVNEDPNGTWELYVSNDGESSDTATVANGWSLDIDVRDPAPTAFAVAAQEVREGTSVIVDVIRGGASPLYAGSVTVATSSGTAEAGLDFASTSYRIDFAPGETTKTVEVPVLADGLGEPAQGFTIALASPEGDVAIGTPGAVGVTIPADPGGVFDDLPQGDQSPPTPRRFSRRNAFQTIPAAGRCRRPGSIIRFRPRMPDGVAIVRSEVFVNGRKIEDNVEEAAVAPITLVMRGRRMRVRIRLHSHDDRVVTIRRKFRACKRKRR